MNVTNTNRYFLGEEGSWSKVINGEMYRLDLVDSELLELLI